jgi:hypothetical protein
MSDIKSIPWWIWLIPVVLLLVATARLPYGYYTFTRIAVCAVAAWLAIVEWNTSRSIRIWLVVFALIAILFNPLIPIYLKRGTWFYLDILTAVAFLAHLGMAKLRRNLTV